MNYPIHLLPKSKYKKIEWSDDLLPLFLARHTPTKDIQDSSGKIKEEYIVQHTDHLRDLSTNLLGEFLITDNKIEVVEKSKDFFCKWSEGDSITMPIFKTDFVLNEDKGCFYWKIDDIISLRFCHSHNIENKYYNLNFKIIHTPIKCNFWHFSIRVFLDDKDEVSSLDISKNLKKQLWRVAKNELRERAIIDTPYFIKLDTKHYS